MSHTVDYPIFLYLVSLAVVPCVHSIRVTAWYLSIFGTCWTIKARTVGIARSKMICLHPLLHNLLPVDWIDYIVACSMQDNGWHDTSCTPHRIICNLPLLRWIGTSLA